MMSEAGCGEAFEQQHRIIGGKWCTVTFFTPKFKRYILPSPFKKGTSEVVIIGSIIIFHLSKLRSSHASQRNGYFEDCSNRYYCMFPRASSQRAQHDVNESLVCMYFLVATKNERFLALGVINR